MPPNLKTLALAPKPSGVLSIIGSSYIVRDVLRDKRKRNCTYHRLMVGLSITDIILSFSGAVLSTWPMPRDAGVWGAVGTVRSCDATGFFFQLTVLAGLLYNVSLASYYYLIVKRNWSNRRLKEVELWLHAVPWTIGLITATAGLALKIYSSGVSSCWMGGYYPPGCNSPETCIRGWNYQPYIWVFFYGIVWPGLIYIVALQLIIYKSVLNQEKRVERFSFCPRFAERLKNRKKSRRVMVQSLLYVGALFVTYILPTIFRLHYIVAKEISSSIILPALIVSPLQGVWNCLIYLKPRFDQWNRKRIRLKAKKERDRVSALDKVCTKDKASREETTQKTEDFNNSKTNNSSGGSLLKVQVQEPAAEMMENKRQSQNLVQFVGGLDVEQDEEKIEEVEEDGNDSSDDAENDYFDSM